MRLMLILLQNTAAQAGVQEGSVWLVTAQFATIFIVIAVIALLAIAMIRASGGIQASGDSTPDRQDERSPLDYGSLYVVVLGISAVVFAFLVILLFANRFGDLSSALGFLTALFGAITGLVGTYFGVKSSSDARQGAQQGAQNLRNLAAGRSITPTVTVAPENATAQVGARHTVTATVIGVGGLPAAAVDVTFRVIAGPDTAVAPATVSTDPSGRAIFHFTNQGRPGTDTIEAAVALGGRGTASVTFKQEDSGTQQGVDTQQGGQEDGENSVP